MFDLQEMNLFYYTGIWDEIIPDNNNEIITIIIPIEIIIYIALII